MKKFLIVTLILVLLAAGGLYGAYFQGIYIDWQPDAEVRADFCAEKEAFWRPDGQGGRECIVLRGVDISSAVPGYSAGEFAAEEEDYLRWFEAVGEMGANTVRAGTVMDDDFYNALYAYNTGHEEPLYLMQGILVSDEVNGGRNDAYSDEFLGGLLKDGRDAVDIIHGRKIRPVNEMRGSGYYLKDISKWVIGFIVGQEWDSGMIAYTDHNTAHTPSYQGEYFSTTAEAGAFEAMLARVMDTMVSYESAKYKRRRPIAFANDPANDPLEYEPSYAAQLSKYNSIDAEHIVPSDKAAAGYFAAYRLYDFCEGFTQYLSESQKRAIGGMAIDTSAAYGGYLDLMAQYHSMPVVAAGYGFSSARGTTDGTPKTETEQGEALVRIYREVSDAGWAGAIISTWQDVWGRDTWNTSFLTVNTQKQMWHDLQSEGENYGLMAFDPGASERACVVDGSSGEWDEDDIVAQTQTMTLSAKYDGEGVYLLVKGERPKELLYIPLDITEESGSRISKTPALRFSRAADFLLCVDKEGGRLLVQERYDSLRENFLFEITGEDPFADYPARDSSAFVPVGMALKNGTLVDESVTRTPEEIQKLRALAVFETGRLSAGSGSKSSAQPDICFGEDAVEIRLPWLLLNVVDPSHMLVCSDYYENYGVETHGVSEIWMGLGDGTDEIKMENLAVTGWLSPKTHERLKESYGIVRAAWKGENADASQR
ncbi:MAG: hypothetical protein DBX46_02800 [Clostridiales bacterium]|nr:MAG: hypothetical protein DBX46_02800 [Clostridiales bacterium]